MYLVEFVATEHVTGEAELDLDNLQSEDDLKELALRDIKFMYPEYDNIEISIIKEI